VTPARRALLGGLLGAGLVAGLIVFGFLEFLELRALDTMFRLRGPRPPKSPIVIVAIDEDTFKALDLQWPLPRSLHGELIDRLRAASPAAIGFDIIFSEPSIRGPADDEVFGSAVSGAGNVVLAANLTRTWTQFGFKYDLNPPLPVIRKGAAAFGFVNLETDQDGSVRRSGELRLFFQGHEQLSFDLQLYTLVVKAGIPAEPFPPDRTVFINYRGPTGTFPVISYYKVLNGEAKRENFAGRIILVGAAAPSLLDVRSTPFAPRGDMPGVEVHANVVETLLNGNSLRETPMWFGAAIAIVAALAAGGLLARLREWALITVPALLALIGGGTFAAFAVWNIWFRPAGVMVAVILGLVGAMAFTLQRGRPR